MDIYGLISQFMVWANETTSSLGYIGLFLVNFVASALIILPVPAFLLVFTSGNFLNPWLVGLTAGAGAAFGELTGYGLGKGGGKVIEKKYRKLMIVGKKWIKGRASFSMIILFAATPLPDDVVGILCGIFNYDIRKFLLASFIGKVMMNTALAWGGFYGLKWLSAIFGNMVVWSLIGIGIIGLILYNIFKSKKKK